MQIDTARGAQLSIYRRQDLYSDFFWGNCCAVVGHVVQFGELLESWSLGIAKEVQSAVNPESPQRTPKSPKGTKNIGGWEIR
eukprot:4349572-Amphidinium_carterae.1